MAQDRKIHLCIHEDTAESYKKLKLIQENTRRKWLKVVVVNSAFIQGRLYHNAAAIKSHLDVQIRSPVGSR